MGRWSSFVEGLRIGWIGLSVVGEVVSALAVRGRLWLIPSVLLIIAVGVFLVAMQASPLSVIIYGLL